MQLQQIESKAGVVPRPQIMKPGASSRRDCSRVFGVHQFAETGRDLREDVERLLITKALGRFGGNVSQAAKALGLSRSALYRRLQHFRL